MIFPDKSLAIRLEKKLAQDLLDYVDSMKKLFPDALAEQVAMGGGVAICTTLPYINSAVGVGLDLPVANANMEQLEAFFLAHQITPTIEICPYTDNTFLNLLNEREYYISQFSMAYVHSLEALPSYTNHNIMVEPIDRADTDIWVETVMDINPEDTKTDTRLAQVAANRPDTTCFLARLDGKRVGASALSIRDSIATLYFTATRQAYRNRGVQSAMIQTRLAYAQSTACEMAFATTIPGNSSMRNVLRAGFCIMYTRCTMQKAM